MEVDSNEFYRNSNKLNMDFPHIYHTYIRGDRYNH